VPVIQNSVQPGLMINHAPLGRDCRSSDPPTLVPYDGPARMLGFAYETAGGTLMVMIRNNQGTQFVNAETGAVVASRKELPRLVGRPLMRCTELALALARSSAESPSDWARMVSSTRPCLQGWATTRCSMTWRRARYVHTLGMSQPIPQRLFSLTLTTHSTCQETSLGEAAGIGSWIGQDGRVHVALCSGGGRIRVR
jgi:hypothetical protein